ncbi:MAG: LysM peptidoglycan-binding domain-containing protein [Bacillota bacterium]|nr:LysM peptidoglycan-binding domain-containing protein [Bacillota bacterium]
MGKRLKTSVAVVSNKEGIDSFSSDNFYFKDKYLEELDTGFPIEAFAQGSQAISVFAVCDGKRTEGPGEIASLAAADGMKHLEHKLRENYSDKPLRNQIPLIKIFISRLEVQLGCLITSGDRAVIGSIGDCKVYLYRNGFLKQLETDDADGISMPFTVYEGDCFLLCSDGVTKALTDEGIAKVMATSGNGLTIANKLVSDSLEYGSKDSDTGVTAMVIRIDAVDENRLTGISTFKPSFNVRKVVAMATITAVAIMLVIGSVSLAKSFLANERTIPNTVQEQQDDLPDLEDAEPVGGTPVDSQPPAENEVDAPDRKAGAANGTAKYVSQGTYEVQPGDTLFGISLKIYNRNVVKEIKDFNEMDSDVIYVGKILKLPKLD